MQMWRWLSAILGAGVLAGTALIVPAAEANAAGAADAAAALVHRGTVPPGHPAVSLPNSSLLTSCGPGDDGIACNQMALAAINQARRALEKLGGMSLSLPAYAKLTPAEQLFVVVNLERTERRLVPVVVLSRSLNAVAQAGASVLAMGAGQAAAARGYRESDTVLLAGVCGPAPRMPRSPGPRPGSSCISGRPTGISCTRRDPRVPAMGQAEPGCPAPPAAAAWSGSSRRAGRCRWVWSGWPAGRGSWPWCPRTAQAR
jgi:hypothetical protein